MSRLAILVAALALVCAACGSSGAAPASATPMPLAVATPPASATTVPTATQAPAVSPGSIAPDGSPSWATPAAPPVAGVVAIGHSGMTGQGTGPNGEVIGENSWVTGTSPTVDSIYLRLRDAFPALAGRAVNKAQGGARVDRLLAQAQAALAVVPHPALVIVEMVDNDVRCDGRDQARIPQFGTALKRALDTIASASPATRILVVGMLGRPTAGFVRSLIERDPGAISSLTGSGECDFLDGHGNVVQQHIDRLISIIDGYEAEQARVCALVPSCSTDGGVRRAWTMDLDDFAADWGHMNIRGQAEEAMLVWPLVEQLFQR